MKAVVLILERVWQCLDARGSDPSLLRFLVDPEKVIRAHRGRGADLGQDTGGVGRALKTETQL